MVTRAFGAAATLLVVSLAGTGGARAADPKAEQARAHFQQGDTFFKLDKYPAALQEFEQAYLAKQDPSFLYNIAQCHRLMGNRVEAIRFYKRFLNDAPTAANRPVAEKHIRDLESAVSAEELTGAHVAHTPTTPTSAPAGTGTAVSPATTAPPPQTVAQEARPPAAPEAAISVPPPPPSSTDDRPVYTKWWFWTAVAGAVVVGGLLIFLSSRDPSCPGGRVCQ
jgi:tetratricopeptide (TPR) repeat protein